MPPEAINRTMERSDLERPEVQSILEELFSLMREMNQKGIPYSSWYGKLSIEEHPWCEPVNRGPDYTPFPGNPDEAKVPWFLLWEIAWVVAHANPQRGHVCLDMGGSSSLFSCFLASRGCTVISVELNPRLVEHQRRIAEAMGWSMESHNVNMLDMEFPPDTFDRIHSICVYEHIPPQIRKRINARLGRFMKPGGVMGITFDYLSPGLTAQINSPADVYGNFVEATGFRLKANGEFVDTGSRWLTNPFCTGLVPRLRGIKRKELPVCALWKPLEKRYTFGALFMQKQ